MSSIRTHIRKSLKTEFQQQIVTFPNGVTAHLDVVYAIEKDFRPLHLDIYNTPDQKDPKPFILFIHGGACCERL